MSINVNMSNASPRASIPCFWGVFTQGLYVVLMIVFICASTASAEDAPPASATDTDTVVNYTWTDENGVVHYSDQKSSPSAKEVIVPKRSEDAIDKSLREINYAWMSISGQVKYYARTAIEKTKSNKWVFAAIAASLVGSVLFVKGLKIYGKKAKVRNKRLSVQSVIQNFKYMRSSLSQKMDRNSYKQKVSGIKSSLAELYKEYPSPSENHALVINLLNKSLQSYEDCAVLWDIGSQDEVEWLERSGYLMRYPSLVAITEQIPRPRRDALSANIRQAVLRYASNYQDKAEAAFSNPPAK